jgi:hypothetical protein
MEPRPSPAASDYWYPALADGRIDVVLRDASKRAWPYAVYCATRYHRDIHVAHELMDDALLRTERYLASSGNSQPTPNRVWYYIVSVLKRLSMQRLRHPEVSSGSLSDLDLIVQHLARGTPQEESAYVNQLVSRMTPRTRQIFYWRLAGHSFRHIARELKADHATIFRAYNKELRELILPRSFTRQSPPGSKPRLTAAKSTSTAGSSK